MKNLVLSLLLLTVSLAAVFGVCLLVKDYEYRANYITSVNKEYAEALENLKEEVNVNIENVTELTKEIELKGLTIDDLTRTVTEYKTQVVVLRETVTEYETIIVEKDNTIASKEQEIQTVTQTVVEYRDRIVYLETDNSNKESEIESLEGSSAEDKARIAELEAEIEANNREIADLCQEIADLEAEIDEKNATIASLQDEIAQLEASKNEVEVQIVEKETIIVEKEEIIVEKEAEIQELNININVLNQTIIELNVKIELLEEAIDKDENKEYILDLVLDNTDGFTFIDINNDNFCLMGEKQTLSDIYLLNKLDYSITLLKENFYIKASSYNRYLGNNLYYLPSLDNTNANLGGFILFNNETLNIDFEYSNVTGGFYRLLIKDDYFIAFGEKANAVKVSLIDLSYTVTSIPKASYFIDRNDGTLFITNTNDGGWARIYDIETDSFTDVIIDESVTSGALSYQINASGFVTSTNKIIYTNGFSGTTGGTFIYTPENNTLYEMCDHVHGYVMNSPTTGISEFIEIGDEIIYDYSYDYFIDMLSFKCHKFNANNLQTDYHYITADRKVLTSGYNGLFLIDIENDSETRMTTYDRTGETLYEELDNGVLVTMFCQEDGNTYYFFYNYETQTISELDEPIRNILLVNATTIDESSFEEESISSLYIGQEVELFITVPMGHYPSHFEVLTLDAEGNEVWTSFDCNGGMNGMTRFNCKFVLEESLIINNTLTIRYNNFTSL